jgi:hypothetical protein
MLTFALMRFDSQKNVVCGRRLCCSGMQLGDEAAFEIATVRDWPTHRPLQLVAPVLIDATPDVSPDVAPDVTPERMSLLLKSSHHL